jgi:hypothetical protein
MTVDSKTTKFQRLTVAPAIERTNSSAKYPDERVLVCMFPTYANSAPCEESHVVISGHSDEPTNTKVKSVEKYKLTGNESTGLMQS